jgi:hypothetical protein
MHKTCAAIGPGSELTCQYTESQLCMLHRITSNTPQACEQPVLLQLTGTLERRHLDDLAVFQGESQEASDESGPQSGLYSILCIGGAKKIDAYKIHQLVESYLGSTGVGCSSLHYGLSRYNFRVIEDVF